MKKRILISLAVLVLAALACQVPLPSFTGPRAAPAPNNDQGVTMPPTAAPRPTIAIVPTPTATSTPAASDEPYLAGAHRFYVVPTQITCPLRSEPYYATILFLYEGEDVLKISHADELDVFETYTRKSPNIYERFNSSGDLIQVEVFPDGYVLRVLNSDTTEVCGYYTFTVSDD